MLIAIMGDTFDRVIEQRPTYSLKNKLMIMSDMNGVIQGGKIETDKIFMYVITPT